MDMTGANAGLTIGESKGRAEQATTTLLAVLEAKFGSVPTEVITAVHIGYADPAKLQAWTTLAAKAATLDEFRATAGL